jgi:hypothetical protein
LQFLEPKEIPLLGYVSQENTWVFGPFSLDVDNCVVVIAVAGRFVSDNQSSMICQSAGRPKSVLELGAAEKVIFFHLAGNYLTKLYHTVEKKRKCNVQGEGKKNS